jgi:hypothetical protein
MGLCGPDSAGKLKIIPLSFNAHCPAPGRVPGLISSQEFSYLLLVKGGDTLGSWMGLYSSMWAHPYSFLLVLSSASEPWLFLRLCSTIPLAFVLFDFVFGLCLLQGLTFLFSLLSWDSYCLATCFPSSKLLCTSWHWLLVVLMISGTLFQSLWASWKENVLISQDSLVAQKRNQLKLA